MSDDPVATGNGWYELSDGRKVQGEEAARREQRKLDGGAVDGPADNIKAVPYLGHTKYVCTVCERQGFHRLNDRVAVEAHIEASH